MTDFPVAALICICLAVAGVGMYSHRSTFMDHRTVMSPIFWALIAGVALALYLGYLVIDFALGFLPAERRTSTVAGVVAAVIGVLVVRGYIRSGVSRAARQEWLEGAITALQVLLVFIAAPGLAGYVSKGSALYMFGAMAVAFGGVIAYNRWRERRKGKDGR